MRVPHGFTLAGNYWEVRYMSKKDLMIPDIDGDMITAYGLCHEGPNEIWIWKKLGPRKRMQTFIHEAAHAVLYTMGFLEHDEQQVEAVSQLVYQLLVTREYEHGPEVGTEKQSSLRDVGPSTARDR